MPFAMLLGSTMKGENYQSSYVWRIILYFMSVQLLNKLGNATKS